jgi:hypothetical protein
MGRRASAASWLTGGKAGSVKPELRGRRRRRKVAGESIARVGGGLEPIASAERWREVM